MNVSESLVTSTESAFPVQPPPDPDDSDSGDETERSRLSVDAVGPIQIATAQPGAMVAAAASAGSADASSHVIGTVTTTESSMSSDRVTTAMAAASGGGPVAITVRTAGAAHEEAAAQAQARADRLIRQIQKGLQSGLDPRIQKEAAALISLISDVVSQEFNEYFPELEIAATALLCERPNLILAQRLRKSVRRRTSLLLRPLLFLRTGHPAIQVLLGLATNLYLALPFALALLSSAVNTIYIPGESKSTYMLVGIAGAIGSIVSILVRIQDFDDQKAEHRSILFFTGFFKPMIGIASALFALMVLKAGLMPIRLPATEAQIFFFVALAFVAGFSERLAGDLVTSTENKLGEAKQGAKA